MKTYHHPVLLSRNLGTLTFWNTLGLPWSVMGLILSSFNTIKMKLSWLIPDITVFSLNFSELFDYTG